MRFNTVVEGARWDEETNVWRVAVAGGERSDGSSRARSSLTARYLITATGFLSQPKAPDIPGVVSFEGKVIHTTEWDDQYPLEGRRAAVIGTGATAVQLIPELTKKVAHLTVYQRTPIWVVPKIDLPFGERAKRLFARIPLTQRAVRWLTDSIYEVMINTAVIHHRHFRRLNIAAADLSKMHRFASIRDKELRRKLTPDYDFGCKRPTFSNGYYRAFTKPNVHLQTEGITRIEADGIVNADGSKTVIDTLVLATGFDLWEANFPAIEVIGRDGRNLGKWWRETSFQAYQGVTMPYFPNYLSLASPFAFLGLNFFNTMEYQMRHMDRLFGELKRRGATTFEVTEDANTKYRDRMTELLGDSLWTIGNCATSRSYYFNPHGEPTLLRPMSTKTAIKEAAEYPLTDYQIA
jgi:cation diffusion facilitator CzcD-associated flavoprotein CzcO